MNREDIIRMAREAGFPFNKYGLLQGDDDNEIDADAMLERFFQAAYDAGAAAEREACAKVCMAVSSDITLLGTAAECVNAIRARGQA